MQDPQSFAYFFFESIFIKSRITMMKGRVSCVDGVNGVGDETKLSFQIIVVDGKLKPPSDLQHMNWLSLKT
jgi:hypothetical protein